MKTLVINWCKQYLKRRGYHVVAPGAIEIMFSGPIVVLPQRNGDYVVRPPYPGVFVTALNQAQVLPREVV